MKGRKRMKLEGCSLSSTVCILVFVLSILAAGGAFAKTTQSLALKDYLGQVSDKHLGYISADLSAKAAKQYAGEGSLIYKPNFFADVSEKGDARNNPFTSGNFNVTRTYSVGISEQTPFGLSGRLTYNHLNIDVPNVTNYTNTYPAIELSLSLWRNFAGKEVRSQAALIEHSALAKSFSQTFQTKTILLEAETLYWRLALAREMVQMQKDAVERAQRIHDWTSRRVRLQLADRAENLQASTNLQARKLDLKNAQDEERAAAQAFNASRGVLIDDVPERLVDLGPDLVSTLTVPARASRRDDIMAAEHQAKASQANTLASREKNKPTVELYGSTPLADPTTPPAALASSIPTSARPGTTIGVRVVAPLDFVTSSKVRQGYDAEARASETLFQRKSFEEERDWAELSSKLRESKERLKLYVELVRSQKEKLDYERERQQRGRSTLQQVLIFENDYALAQPAEDPLSMQSQELADRRGRYGGSWARGYRSGAFVCSHQPGRESAVQRI